MCVRVCVCQITMNWLSDFTIYSGETRCLGGGPITTGLFAPKGEQGTLFFISLLFLSFFRNQSTEKMHHPEEEEDYDYESLGSNTTMLQNAFAGALAGIAEHCAMYPVDSIKVNWSQNSDTTCIWWHCIRRECKWYRPTPRLFNNSLQWRFEIYGRVWIQLFWEQDQHMPYILPPMNFVKTILELIRAVIIPWLPLLLVLVRH